MAERGSTAGGDGSGSGPQVSRRTFVTATGAAALEGAQALAQPIATLGGKIENAAGSAAQFVKSGNFITLYQGGVDKWTIDKRWFDLASTRLSIGSNGHKLSIDGTIGGTNIQVRLDVTIAGNDLAFSFFSGPPQTITIDDWFSKAHAVTGKLNVSGTGAIVSLGRAKGALPFKLQHPFNFSIAAPLSYAGDSCGDGTCAEVSFMAENGSAEVDVDVVDLVPGAKAVASIVLGRAALANPSAGWRLGNVGGRVLRLFYTGDEGQITIDRLAVGSGLAHVVRRQGGSVGSSGARLRYGEESFGRDLHVGSLELLVVAGSQRSTLRILRDDQPAYIEADRFAAAVRIAEDKSFRRFDGSAGIDITVELLVLHARGEDQSRVDVDFRSIDHDDAGPKNLLVGLNRSAPLWNTEGTKGVSATLLLGNRAGTTTGSLIQLGATDAVEVALSREGADGIQADTPVVRLRRSIDALDIGLLFHKYSLRVGAKTELVPHDGAQRGVRFNPQHLEEESFEGPAAKPSLYSRITGFLSTSALTSAPATDPSRRTWGSKVDSVYFPGGPETILARTQVAGASRIIFAAEGKPPRLNLRTEDLTAWHDLVPVVAGRAVGDIPIADQLALVHYVKDDTDRDEAKKLVATSLQPPAAGETSLELVTGLLFSPDKNARFRTTEPSGSRPEIWTAQLETRVAPPVKKLTPGEPADLPLSSFVRAIWADGFEPDLLFKDGCPAAAPSPFPTSTSRQDRIEIALQSSAFGLLAARAITLQGVDVPNSRVRRLKESDWKALIDPQGIPAPGAPPGSPEIVQEGLFSPAPFQDFSARLTGYGADLDAEWLAEPAAPYQSKTKGPFFKNAFQVERYVHRTRLGSDIYAQVVYKGFLFPYGFRVSLVKITQREPQPLDEFGAMMPLITRYYIVPKPVTKSYPGIYQPYDGREIPVKTARLLGERSPEIDEKEMKAPPGMTLPGPNSKTADCPPPGVDAPPRVFWPVLKSGGRLAFDFVADDSTSRRTLPMLFVGNMDAQNPDSVREIIRYYNAQGDNDRREDHHRAMTTFAPPKPPATGSAAVDNNLGATSFETDHILLGARPRSVPTAPDGIPPGDDAPYVTDAFMNGADEPPFYPVMVEASIVVPPLDRIMGSPQGLKRVGFNSTYVRDGFDEGKNRPEIYLNFLNSGVMALGGNGQVTGGLVQTPTNAAAISRINAIVGATSTLQLKTFKMLGSDVPVGSDSQAPWNYDTLTKDKKFKPSEFFKEATLLGVVDLKDVIDAVDVAEQPLLKEVYGYATGAVGADAAKAVKAIAEACKQGAGLIDAALKAADDKLKELFANDVGGPEPAPAPTPPPAPTPTPSPTPGTPPEVSIERYYPELSRQLTDFAQELRQAPETLEAMPAWATKIVAKWNSTKASIDAVIANPSPEPLRAGMYELRVIVDSLKSGLGNTLRTDATKALNDLISGAIQDFIDALIDASVDAKGEVTFPWLFEALTGREPPAKATKADLHAAIDKMFADGKIPPGLDQAILANALALPLFQVVGRIQSTIDTVASLEGPALAAAARGAADAAQAVLGARVQLEELIAAAKLYLQKLCGNAAGALNLDGFVRLVREMVPDPTDLDAKIVKLRGAWPTLDLAGLPSSPSVDAAQQASTNLRLAVDEVRTGLIELNKVRSALDPASLADMCTQGPQQLATLGARLVAARNAIFPGLTKCAARARDLEIAYAALPQAQISAALTEFDAMRTNCLKLAADLTWQRYPQIAADSLWLDSLPVVGPRVHEVRASAAKGADDLRARVALITTATVADLGRIVQDSLDQAQIEQRLLGLASDFAALTDALLLKVEAIRDTVVGAVAAPLVTVHTTVLHLVNTAVTEFDKAPDLVKQFTGQLYTRLLTAQTHLVADIGGLQAAPGTPAFDQLLERWGRGEFAIGEAAGLVVDFFNALMTGQIGGIFDLGAVRKFVEDTLRQLIPTKVDLSYDMKAELHEFLIFAPRDDKQLTIGTHIAVDLLKPADRKVEVLGKVSPFDLKLFGGVDLLTISFSGATFSYDGSTSHFDAQVTSVTPGAALGFFNKINDVTGKEGDRSKGFYYERIGALEGLRVGYAFQKPVLELGGLQITNFGFDASLELYFNGSAAVTKFAIASRDAPCGITILPAYYGSGYFSISSNAKQVLAFEIQLEGGLSRQLNFGPLSGHASITAGIYLMSAVSGNGRTTILEGFVHAIGEGHIACFGISVNLEVKVQQKTENDRKDVSGQASYRFSFRVGLVKVGYGVTAHYQFDGSNSGARAALASRKPPTCLPIPDKTVDWLCYRDNFVADWPSA